MIKENNIYFNNKEKNISNNIYNKMLKLQYKYIVDPKYEKNNLTFKEKILKPDIKKINENLESILLFILVY